jgi:hypothetical protein
MSERVEVVSARWASGLPEDRARRLLLLLFQDLGVSSPAEAHPDNGHALGDREGPQLSQADERESRERAGGRS